MFNELQGAKDELLREAAKAGNQIFKIGDGTKCFVKAKRGYSHPEDLRILYLRAFDELVSEGSLKSTLENKDFELYEVLPADGHIATKASAKVFLLNEIQTAGYIFKIHSSDGEFVQVGTKTFYERDAERILLMQALYELVRHGKLDLIFEGMEFSKFGIRQSQPAKTQTQINLSAQIETDNVQHIAKLQTNTERPTTFAA